MGIYAYDIISDLMVLNFPLPFKLKGYKVLDPNIYLEDGLVGISHSSVGDILEKNPGWEDITDFVFIVEDNSDFIFDKVSGEFQYFGEVRFSLKKKFEFILQQRVFKIYVAKLLKR
jgi:hypothetical protein